MSDNIFKEGGPHNMRRTGPDEFRMSINIPKDDDGMFGRECPNEDCSPGYFKVKPGTGITEGQEKAFCPYCNNKAEPNEFTTKAQKDYAIALVKNEAIDGVKRMIGASLGLGSSGKKKIGGGLVSIEMSFKPARTEYVSRPIEEELRRDITCPHCGLEHSVFGLATWCADCGKDIFLSHVDKEFQVVEKMLSVIETRRIELGARVAGRDIENALEDIVSAFEAVLKLITRQHFTKQGMSPEEIVDTIEKKIRNQYQNIDSAAVVFKKYIGLDLFDGISSDDIDALRTTFGKRHPITHNLGIIDRKYLDQVRTGELQGREIRVSSQEVLIALEKIRSVIYSAYQRA